MVDKGDKAPHNDKVTVTHIPNTFHVIFPPHSTQIALISILIRLLSNQIRDNFMFINSTKKYALHRTKWVNR